MAVLNVSSIKMWLPLLVLVAGSGAEVIRIQSQERSGRSQPHHSAGANHVSQLFLGPSYADPHMLSAVMAQADRANFEYNYQQPGLSIASNFQQRTSTIATTTAETSTITPAKQSTTTIQQETMTGQQQTTPKTTTERLQKAPPSYLEIPSHIGRIPEASREKEHKKRKPLFSHSGYANTNMKTREIKRSHQMEKQPRPMYVAYSTKTSTTSRPTTISMVLLSAANSKNKINTTKRPSIHFSKNTRKLSSILASKLSLGNKDSASSEISSLPTLVKTLVSNNPNIYDVPKNITSEPVSITTNKPKLTTSKKHIITKKLKISEFPPSIKYIPMETKSIPKIMKSSKFQSRRILKRRQHRPNLYAGAGKYRARSKTRHELPPNILPELPKRSKLSSYVKRMDNFKAAAVKKNTPKYSPTTPKYSPTTIIPLKTTLQNDTERTTRRDLAQILQSNNAYNKEIPIPTIPPLRYTKAPVTRYIKRFTKKNRISTPKPVVNTDTKKLPSYGEPVINNFIPSSSNFNPVLQKMKGSVKSKFTHPVNFDGFKPIPNQPVFTYQDPMETLNMKASTLLKFDRKHERNPILKTKKRVPAEYETVHREDFNEPPPIYGSEQIIDPFIYSPSNRDAPAAEKRMPIQQLNKFRKQWQKTPYVHPYSMSTPSNRNDNMRYASQFLPQEGHSSHGSSIANIPGSGKFRRRLPIPPPPRPPPPPPLSALRRNPQQYYNSSPNSRQSTYRNYMNHYVNNINAQNHYSSRKNSAVNSHKESTKTKESIPIMSEKSDIDVNLRPSPLSFSNFFSNFHNFMGDAFFSRRRESKHQSKKLKIDKSSEVKPTVHKIFLPHSKEKFNAVGPFKTPPRGQVAMDKFTSQFSKIINGKSKVQNRKLVKTSNKKFQATTKKEQEIVMQGNMTTLVSGDTTEISHIVKNNNNNINHIDVESTTFNRTEIKDEIKKQDKIKHDLHIEPQLPKSAEKKSNIAIKQNGAQKLRSSISSLLMNLAVGHKKKTKDLIYVDLDESVFKLPEPKLSKQEESNLQPIARDNKMKAAEIKSSESEPKLEKSSRQIDGVINPSQLIGSSHDEPSVSYGGWSVIPDPNESKSTVDVYIKENSSDVKLEADKPSRHMVKSARAYTGEPRIITLESLGYRRQVPRIGSDVVVGRTAVQPRPPTGFSNRHQSRHPMDKMQYSKPPVGHTGVVSYSASASLAGPIEYLGSIIR